MNSTFLLRSLPRACATIAAALLLSASARADTVALDYTGGSIVSSVQYTLGWSFSLSSPITITHIGIFDYQNNGLIDSHAVGIFNTSGSVPLVSGTIASGTGAELIDGFRYISVTPTVLAAGTYNIGAYYATGADAYIYSASTVSLAGPVTFGAARSNSGLALANPTGGGSGNSYIAPNFQFVPEPTTALLFLGGAAGLLLRRRRSGNRTH
jgi:hypothetical protein